MPSDVPKNFAPFRKHYLATAPGTHVIVNDKKISTSPHSYLTNPYNSLPIPAKVRWSSGNSSITCRMLMKYKTAMPVS